MYGVSCASGVYITSWCIVCLRCVHDVFLCASGEYIITWYIVCLRCLRGVGLCP